MTSAKSILIDALGKLEGGAKWIKGEYGDGCGCFCSAGAVIEASGGFQEGTPALDCLAGAMRARKTSDRVCITSHGEVTQFNDHPTTTWAEVEEAFIVAISSLVE